MRQSFNGRRCIGMVEVFLLMLLMACLPANADEWGGIQFKVDGQF